MNIKNRIAKSATCGLLALSLATGAAGIWAQEYEGTLGRADFDRGDDMLLDLVVVRPLEIFGYALGFSAWVVSLPFTIPSESVPAAANELVGRPFEYAFWRPLGNWHQCGSDKHPC